MLEPQFVVLSDMENKGSFSVCDASVSLPLHIYIQPYLLQRPWLLRIVGGCCIFSLWLSSPCRFVLAPSSSFTRPVLKLLQESGHACPFWSHWINKYMKQYGWEYWKSRGQWGWELLLKRAFSLSKQTCFPTAKELGPSMLLCKMCHPSSNNTSIWLTGAELHPLSFYGRRVCSILHQKHVEERCAHLHHDAHVNFSYPAVFYKSLHFANMFITT